MIDVVDPQIYSATEEVLSNLSTHLIFKEVQLTGALILRSK